MRAMAGALCAYAWVSALPACASHAATAQIETPARGNMNARSAPSMPTTTAGTSRNAHGCVMQRETITNIPAVRVIDASAQQALLWRQAEIAPTPLPIVAPNL